MSALAARRAAAAAASSSSSPAPSITPMKTTPSTIQSTPSSSKARTPRPPPQSPSASSSETEYTEAVASTYARTPNKRRKIEKSPPVKQRYFVQAEPTPKTKSRARAFSPSAPAESDPEDGDDSSDEEITFEDEEAAAEVDEGTVRWDAGISAPPTPGPETRRVERSSSRRGDVGTSGFGTRDGINVVKVSEQSLNGAGLHGDGPGVAVSLSEGETLMIAGSYTVTPLQQPVTLLSTTLYPESAASFPVFAPASHPVPMLEASTGSALISSPLLVALALPKTFLTSDAKQPRTVLVLRENRTGLEGLRAGAVPGFSNIWLSETGPWGLRGVHPVIGSFPTPVYPYISPPSWPAALSALSPTLDMDETAAPVVIVKGPKRTGKSTIARAALNNLLVSYRQVAWLECDLGQGEFGCGGLVGLWIVDRPVFSPPFTHPQNPFRAHYLGTYTPLTCPDEYIAAIRHLLEVYKYEIQYPTSSPSSSKRTDVVPLVINTQGWVKGLGEDLLRGIEAAASPTHVFAFDYPPLENDDIFPNSPVFNPALLPPDQGGPSESARVFVLEPAPVSPLQARYTSADMRILSLITYLHSGLPAALPCWDFTVPLGAHQPVEVNVGVDGPLKEIYLLGEGSEGILEDDLELTLNGAIVALGHNELPPQDVYSPARQLPPHDDFNILGLALIRGIRRTSSGFTLHLVTPLKADKLVGVNCIVHNGAIELPLCGLLDWREEGGKGEKVFGAVVESGEAPFLDSGRAGGVGVERRRIRRNLQRRNV